jgi:hypothetical protein
VRVRAARQVIAVEAGLRCDGHAVDAQQAAGGDAQEPVEPGLGGDHPAQLGSVVGGAGVGVGDQHPEPCEELGADRGVAFGAVGVLTDDEFRCT